MVIKGVNVGEVFLAPMAGVTHMPFRMICKEMGCGLSYTEMISAKGILYDNENTKELLEIGDCEHPVAVQLFGSSPEALAESVRRIEDRDFDIIDINMGCPAPKIVKNGDGCALMKDPLLVGRIVKAVCAATKKPVTVKIRKGFEDANAVLVAKTAEDNGAAAVTVHGRTRAEYYSGKADLGIISEVKRVLKIPVIGNGDVCSGESARAMLEETGCDAVMIGRAAQGNPWIFRSVAAYLQNQSVCPPTREEIIETAMRHYRMLAARTGEHGALLMMRKHFSWYTKGFENASALRDKINKAADIKAVMELFGLPEMERCLCQK